MVNNRDGLFMTPRVTKTILSFSSSLSLCLSFSLYLLPLGENSRREFAAIIALSFNYNVDDIYVLESDCARNAPPILQQFSAERLPPPFVPLHVRLYTYVIEHPLTRHDARVALVAP